MLFLLSISMFHLQKVSTLSETWQSNIMDNWPDITMNASYIPIEPEFELNIGDVIVCNYVTTDLLKFGSLP